MGDQPVHQDQEPRSCCYTRHIEARLLGDPGAGAVVQCAAPWLAFQWAPGRWQVWTVDTARDMGKREKGIPIRSDRNQGREPGCHWQHWAGVSTPSSRGPGPGGKASLSQLGDPCRWEAHGKVPLGPCVSTGLLPVICLFAVSLWPPLGLNASLRHTVAARAQRC